MSGETAPPWLERHARPIDITGALVLTVLMVLGALGEAHPIRSSDVIPPGAVAPPVAYLLVAAAGLVLLRRRRWPIGTLIASTVAVLVYTALGYVNGAALLAPVVGIYTAIAGAELLPALVASGSALVLLSGAEALFGPFGPLGGSLTVLPFMAAAAAGLGLAVRNRRAYVAEIQDRSARAEQRREEETRRRIEAERLRIARELHDVVAHTISVVHIQAKVATQVIPDPPPQGAQALAAITAASKEALRELRNILGLLRQPGEPSATSPGGLAQLGELVATTTQAGLPVTVTTTGTAVPVPPAVDLAAYRIVQESLTNSLRHAGPARASVSLRYSPAELVVEVSDDGPGAPSPGGGYGIAGMRERAHATGGSLDAGPLPGGGFRVHARLPLTEPS